MKAFFVFLDFFFIFNYSFSQKKNTYSKYYNLLSAENNQHLQNSNNYRGLSAIYKNFISSADYQTCPKYLSFFKFKNLKKDGVFWTLIKGLIILSHCSRFQETYFEHTLNNNLIDLP